MEENTEYPITSKLVQLVDFLFVPTSLIRFAHHTIKEGLWTSDNYFSQNIYPYISTGLLEFIRLSGYYELGKYIVENIS